MHGCNVLHSQLPVPYRQDVIAGQRRSGGAHAVHREGQVLVEAREDGVKGLVAGRETGHHVVIAVGQLHHRRLRLQPLREAQVIRMTSEDYGG